MPWEKRKESFRPVQEKGMGLWKSSAEEEILKPRLKQEWAVCCNIDEPIDYHTEKVRPRKTRYFMIPLTGRMSSMIQMNLSVKQRQTHRCREQTCGCWGQARGRMNWEF